MTGVQTCALPISLYFKEIGFNLHDAMIYQKNNNPLPEKNRYFQSFEYMFILSKGKPKTFNPIKDRKNINAGLIKSKSSIRNKDGSTSITKTSIVADFGSRKNIWKIDCGYMKSSKDKISYKHSATFPEKLAHRSEEHTSELQSHSFISYAVFCLKKKKKTL